MADLTPVSPSRDANSFSFASAAGSAADRTAKATEETAKNTKKLVDKANAGGLTFS